MFVRKGSALNEYAYRLPRHAPRLSLDPSRRAALGHRRRYDQGDLRALGDQRALDRLLPPGDRYAGAVAGLLARARAARYSYRPARPGVDAGDRRGHGVLSGVLL